MSGRGPFQHPNSPREKRRRAEEEIHRLEEDELSLYDAFICTLEDTYTGYAALSKNRQLLIGNPTDSVLDVLAAADRAFGPGNHIFKIGSRTWAFPPVSQSKTKENQE